MATATLGSLKIPHFVVKQLKPHKYGLTEDDLIQKIQDVELQTRITNAALMKVHVIDPEWEVITSGLIRVDEDGLLNEIVVEFPEGTGYRWQLSAVEGSTEVGQANLILTFEDYIVARLRQQWKPRTFPPGLTTRAQVVKTLVEEVNLKEHLHPPIKFISPGLNRVEPVAEAKETKSAKLKKEAEENKGRGLHAGAELTIGGAKMNQTQATVANELLKVANEENAGAVATEALLYAAIGETKMGGENSTSSANAKGVLQSLSAPFDTESQAKNFLNGNTDFHTGAKKLAEQTSNPKQIAVEVERPSIWPTNIYETESGGTKYLEEAQAIFHAGGGVKAGGTTPTKGKSDVGQLSRGSPNNPDEDSWECITRLAQEVNWSAFTDGRDTLYYMDGPDLIHQRPVLYIDGHDSNGKALPLSNYRIIREDKGGQKEQEFGALIRPLVFNYDNTAFKYEETTKVKGKLQRKARVARPQTPAEIRLLLLCGITEYRAGDVFVFRNCGPISANGGRWIVSDATRQCLRYPYTQFILVPPTVPGKEPEASATSSEPKAPGEGGTALAAFNAASELSEMQLPYVFGGGHGSGALSKVKKGGEGLDCSSSTCWVLWKAGLFKSTSSEVSGELESWDEAGKGKELTVWANAEHVFIEFTIPGHSRAQMNTAGSQNGPRLYTLGERETHPSAWTYNENPEHEGFTARHPKGL